MVDGILCEDRGMRLSVMMHDLPLVIDDILYSQRRGDHLTGGAEMIELTTCQRYDSHRQRTEFRVIDGRLGTRGSTEFGIEVVFFEWEIGVLRVL